MAKFQSTHLDKVFFPKAKVTKGDLFDYYREVSQFILPYLKDRPHSLLRQPDGLTGEAFFQKNIEEPPKWLRTKTIYSKSTEEDVTYLVGDDLDHLIYMVQLGCIEINPWNSRVGQLDKPDWLILDLDPEGIGFEKVVETAKAVKVVCDDLDMPTYPKTSGKTGIHIYVPLGANYAFKEVRQLAEILANLINLRTPDFTSVRRLPKKRRGKVYVDFLQNSQGQTSAAPYSVRPTPESTVSTPLHWDEVNARLDPKKFTIKNTSQRLAKVGDLWKPVLGKGIDVEKILERLNL
ncbi:hypothetical protein A3F65_00855 [Candidatus Saccharibacteria bacterium RIFCSPHIGHO2_12_FULL_47_16b]|nr:MAG: hypothetical protein A3F65_00855 [Candidatus Saccharibacteria bacterium RIFCSPHIGHO2_12_FULL_47_16b]